MTALAMAARAPLSPAMIFGGLQLVLGLTWAVYALFLPQLVVAAGLPRTIVPWVLVIDQLVFALSDPWAGAAGDRAAAQARRIGAPVAWLAGGSGLAFLLMPMTAHPASGAFLGVLLLVWAVGTAALRAPLAALLGRYLPGSDAPNAALISAGLALAGVAGGSLVPALREVSPYVAFAWAGVGTALVAWLAVPAERWAMAGAQASGAANGAAAEANGAAAEGTGATAEASASNGATPSMALPARPELAAGWGVPLFASAALLAAGLQFHAFVSGPAALGKSGASALPTVFWIGAALACGVFVIVGRQTDMRLLCARAAAGGVLALAGFGLLDAVAAKAAAHLLAGVAWGVVLSGVFVRVFAFGRASGRVGLAVGCLFGLLALATLIRIALGALGLWSAIGAGAALWAAGACWTAAAVLLLMPQESRPAPA
ncbi:MAG: hypothetical protein KAY46_19290 [Burkholderiaceae bacterium]|nr:hypothetical protein [Burkholderiaceae bacterium]